MTGTQHRPSLTAHPPELCLEGPARRPGMPVAVRLARGGERAATCAAWRGKRDRRTRGRHLTAILDDAVADGHIERNPARGKRIRLRVPKPQRTFLELDEVRALIDAAAGQDAPSAPKKVTASSGETATRVAALLSRGMSQGDIASELGLAKSTVNWHARRLGVHGPVPYSG